MDIYIKILYFNDFLSELSNTVQITLVDIKEVPPTQFKHITGHKIGLANAAKKRAS